MISWGSVPLGSVLPFHFGTYGKTNGESITMTGLAVTDIEVYKGATVTQRSSDAGYALIDTDGIDIDGLTGAHGFSIDTGDNTDAGFFAAGSFYTVWVSSVTVDGQTVNFIAGTFRLVAAENTAGTPVADAVRISGDATAADNAESFFDGTGYAGTNNVIPTVTTLTGHTPQTGDAYARLGAPVGSSISDDIAALPTAAEINAEMVDVFTVDTYAEPSGVPAATATLEDKISWLAALARNKITQTASTQTLRNDADSGNIATSALSDDGTTMTRAEWT